MSTDRDLSLSLTLAIDCHLIFYSPSSSTPMSSPSPINISVYLLIANTVNILLSCYHPLIPWLAMRQSDHSPLRLGQTIGLEHIHGPSFLAQLLPVLGCR